MALTRIGTTRDVVAFTLTGDSGWRTPHGKNQAWATAGTTTVALEPGTYLIEGPPNVAQYNRSPWVNEGNMTTPAVVEYSEGKQLYCAHNGVLKITRL